MENSDVLNSEEDGSPAYQIGLIAAFCAIVVIFIIVYIGNYECLLSVPSANNHAPEDSAQEIQELQ